MKGSMFKCPNCGHDLDINAKVCYNCGYTRYQPDPNSSHSGGWGEPIFYGILLIILIVGMIILID